MACIHDDIMAMPMGYDTVVSAGGTSLSGGQRQRLALARALLQRPNLLVLDEATSHLDAITEAHVHENLERSSGTRIIIAHRLSTIANADLILVMEAGQIVERGTHHDVLELGGVYADLQRSQMKGTHHSALAR